jgi:hypothetical protein
MQSTPEIEKKAFEPLADNCKYLINKKFWFFRWLYFSADFSLLATSAEAGVFAISCNRSEGRVKPERRRIVG